MGASRTTKGGRARCGDAHQQRGPAGARRLRKHLEGVLGWDSVYAWNQETSVRTALLAVPTRSKPCWSVTYEPR